jgi:hypothetical protein
VVTLEKADMSPAQIEQILQRMPKLPDTAVVPIAVVAEHDNVSPRTVRRRYPLVKLSPNRSGVSVGYLRNHHLSAA